MTLSEIRKLCLSLPAVTEEIQWKKDLLFKVGGKMFLCMGTDPDSRYSFKCSEAAFNELIEMDGIQPAPYLARANWVQIDPGVCRLGKLRLEKLIRESYRLVFEKLPKKTQRTLVKPPAKKKAARQR